MLQEIYIDVRILTAHSFTSHDQPTEQQLAKTAAQQGVHGDFTV